MTKISGIGVTETDMANVGSMEGERPDGTSVEIPLSVLEDHIRAVIAAEPSYLIHRIYAIDPGAAYLTFNVNSTSYIAMGSSTANHIDLDAFPATHFRIIIRGLANAAASTISLQLIQGLTVANVVHTGGNDVASIVNTDAVYDSGWRSRDDGLTGLQRYSLGAKGSTATVDLQVAYIELHWAINP